MMLTLFLMMWRKRYEAMDGSLAGSLELMMVSMKISVTTRDGTPYTASQLAKFLVIPRSTIDRPLEALLATGHFSKIKNRYVADLDYLDSHMTSLSYLDRAIGIIETCLTTLKELREQLRHKMDK